jgi:ketosteroid isomerase-like protein
MRLTTLGWGAANRGDYEVPLLFYEPDVEIRSSAEFARSLGLAESYHGHQGFVEVWRDILQDMTEARFEPEGVIDLGDRVAVRPMRVSAALAVAARPRAGGA